MSIDTLKSGEGYRSARYRDASRALKAGHTEHLQTEHGTIAIRPMSVSDGRGRATLTWLIDFSNHSTEKPENRDNNSQRFTNRLAAIRHVLTCLNGKAPAPEFAPHDYVSVWANQAEREATVLAVLGDEVLLEYEMPGTTSQWDYNRRTGQYRHPADPTSALRVVQVIQNKIVGDYKSMSYKKVTKRWLQAIREAGTTDWLGMGQRSGERIPFPGEHEHCNFCDVQFFDEEQLVCHCCGRNR